jgi:general secretion pathway protein G
MKIKFTHPNTKYPILHTGFTLIEMLVVISIIGILAVLIAANLNSARSRARDAERKSDLKNMETALRLYYNDYGAYPANNSSYLMKACGASGVISCDWGSEWNVGNTIYMQTLPKDPLSSQYRYRVGTSADGFTSTDDFTLQACLENASDSNGVATTDVSWCPSKLVFQISE